MNRKLGFRIRSSIFRLGTISISFPGHTRVETRHSIRSICVSPLYIHLPDDLGRFGLSDLLDTRRCSSRKGSGQFKFHIAVRQLIDAPTPKGIQTRIVLPDQGGYLVAFIKLKDCGTTVTVRISRRRACSHLAIQDAQVSVVQHCDCYRRDARIHQRWKVLCVKPLAGISAS
jgi:hypothetical protein